MKIIITTPKREVKPEKPQKGKQVTKIEFPLWFRIYDFVVNVEDLFTRLREKYLYSDNQLSHYNWLNKIRKQKQQHEENVIDA